MLSFIRMFRGTFHMMFCRLNWSSQATVIAPTRPSFRPAVWSVRRAPFGREASACEDDVAAALEALDLPVHRHLVSDRLEVPADALQLIRELDAEQVVRGADVLSPPVSDVAGDHQLDLLEQSSVLFDSVTDVGHVRFLRALRLMFCRDMYLGVSMEVRGRSAVHHRENDGRSPSITLPDDPSMTMNICFPLCAYSMNHTGAWSNSPSYVVGYTWIDSRLSTRVFACFSANLCESAAAWDFASASVTSPLCTSTPPVWRLSKFILLCNWNWNPSSG